MELRQFAEQVLFSSNLEEKLSCPEQITDVHPGKPIPVPDSPGRPAALVFKRKDDRRSGFPGARELESVEHRSRLLHFFANHELLATELMALVLLRFPDAPAAFRRGVVQTLKDEQRHTRMYLKRMEACGMAFGELPLSGYFWRTVSPMQHPIDYVSRLCLTFEQANLDFSRHFAEEFNAVGDEVSAKLMNRIYQDEIGHVAYGLKWFRRWKNPTETDWDAFCRQLKFPLSPQRAKGFSINIAGREAAGLDRDFIEQLSVYSQSRGRTPNVFVFNALAEGHIAHGRRFSPVKRQMQLIEDLENLPQFLCRRDDVVLVRRKPSIHFLSFIQQAGFDLPEFVELKDGGIRRESSLPNRKLNDLKPWAWSPDSVGLLAPLMRNATGDEVSGDRRFNREIRGLYSKKWSAEFLGRCLEKYGDDKLFCVRTDVGVAVSNIDDALNVITEIRSRGQRKLVAKESIGLAGANAIRIWEPALLDPQRVWMERVFQRGGELLIEPWMERVVDFSVQLEMTGSGLKVLGYTGLINDLKGQFKGNRAEPHHRRRISSSVPGMFDEPHIVERALRKFYDAVFARLESELQARGFVGPVGIDAFVHRDAESGLRVKPIVEINPRYTMGRLTIELMKHVSPGSCGVFRIVNRSDLKQLEFDSFESYATALTENSPIGLVGQPKSRIANGALCLSDPARAQVSLATFCVEPADDKGHS